MKETLLEGDFVWVDKLSYGARLPFHPIAVPYSDRFYSSAIELPYIRMPGLGGVQRMDLLAFEDPAGSMEVPQDKRRLLMKRCVGLPGDSIKIRGKQLLVNDARMESPDGVLHHYHVKADSDSIVRSVLDRYKLQKRVRMSNHGDYVVPMTKDEAKEIAKEPKLNFVEFWEGEKNPFGSLFPKGSDFHEGSPGDIGPLWIPEKGAEVRLDTSNLPLYERIIEVYEGHELQVVDGDIHIDGKLRTHYSFEMDYFYVLGDARPYSKDSRTWGFLPEDHIIGKPLFVLFSYDRQKGDLRWGRTLKGL